MMYFETTESAIEEAAQEVFKEKIQLIVNQNHLQEYTQSGGFLVVEFLQLVLEAQGYWVLYELLWGEEINKTAKKGEGNE